MIVIVDDDPAARESLHLLLECAGFEALEFGSAADCLEDGRYGEASCLILDVNMPGMNGLELLELLRSGGIGIPTIVISGRPSQASTDRALKAGAVAVLDKPFQSKVILSLVESAVAHHR
jgi:FixJ family two-component response regulator